MTAPSVDGAEAASGWRQVGRIDPTGPCSPYALMALTRPHRAQPAPGGVLALDKDHEAAVAHVTMQGDGVDTTCALLDPPDGTWRDAIPLATITSDLLRPDLRGVGAARGTAGSPRPAAEPLAPGAVFIAVVDDALAFAHERFRDAAGRSRVDFLWLQGAPWAPEFGDPPFGRILDRAQVNDAMDRHRIDGGPVDEDGLYRGVGLIDMGRREIQTAAQGFSHGVAVADIAGGMRGGAAANYPLAFVSLPSEVTRDTSGALLAPFVIAAVARILSHVSARGVVDRQSYGVVINLSFGLTGGGKDGIGAVERYLDHVIAQKRPGLSHVRVVLPAGNHRQSRTRARVAPGASGLFWSLPPDDRTPSFLEFWGPSLPARPAGPGFGLSLQPPSSGAFALSAPDFDTIHDLVAGGFLQARLWSQWRADDGSIPDGPGRAVLTLATPPTSPAAPGDAFVTPGDWAVTLLAEDGGPQAVDVFVQRDDTLPGFRRRGRQSRLRDARYAERDAAGRVIEVDDGRSAVLRQGTVNQWATGSASTVVAGTFADTGRIAPYSGLAMSANARPFETAPCERSALRRGMILAGSRSGARVTAAGVSFAAPVVARRLAGWPE